MKSTSNIGRSLHVLLLALCGLSVYALLLALLALIVGFALSTHVGAWGLSETDALHGRENLDPVTSPKPPLVSFGVTSPTRQETLYRELVSDRDSSLVHQLRAQRTRSAMFVDR